MQDNDIKSELKFLQWLNAYNFLNRYTDFDVIDNLPEVIEF